MKFAHAVILSAALTAALFPPPALATPLTDARAALDRGDLAAAAAILEPAHAAAPRDAVVAHLLARVELARGNAGRGLELAELAANRGPGVADHHFLLGTALAANIDSMGMLRKARAAGRMRDAWERAVELDPDHLNARFALVGFYARAPGIVGGGRDKAEAAVAEIARRDAVQGHRARAVLLRIDGDDDGALAEYDRALARVADDTDATADLQVQRGFLCQQMERWPCAHDAFTAAILADPEHMPAWYQIGRTAVFSGERLDEGIAAFTRYLSHTPPANEPSLAWAHTRMGTLHERAGRPDDARAAYEAALRLEPGHEGAVEALAALARN